MQAAAAGSRNAPRQAKRFLRRPSFTLGVLRLLISLTIGTIFHLGIRMADDEGVCPKPAIEEACKPECIKQLLAYQQCVKRIEGKPEAHCTGQYFDYWHCVDHCTAPRLFSVLK